MALGHDHQVVPHLAQVDFLGGDHAVARDQNTALPPQSFHLLLTIGFLLVVKLHNVVHVGAPLGQLTLPVHFHCRRDDDKDLRDVFTVEETLAQSGHLDSLTEAHIVA